MTVITSETLDHKRESSGSRRPGRRLVLLLGAARSGTTWLGNILNSSPSSLYSHEPLLRFSSEHLQPLLTKIRQTGHLSPEEREFVVDQWSLAHFAMRRPPFFRKSHLRWPSSIMWGAWLTVRASNRGHRLFQRLFSPSRSAQYDLVVKQGGLALWGRKYVSALAPDALIVIIRHPWKVIASMRRGLRLNLMRQEDRIAWLDSYLPMCERAGFRAAQVEAMSNAEFEALYWLLENNVYLALAEDHPNSRVVDYRDLRANPMDITHDLFKKLGWPITKQTRKFLRATAVGRSRPILSRLTAAHPYFSVYASNNDSVERCLQELTPRELEEIAAVAQPLLQRFWPDQLTGSGDEEPC